MKLGPHLGVWFGLVTAVAAIGAKAVAANITVVGPTGGGDLRISAAAFTTRTTTIEFSAGQTRANNAILSLTGGPEGAVTVKCDIASGATHVVLDVSGYFR